MGRPARAPGTWGVIRTEPLPAGGYRARVYVRDYDGARREVERKGPSKDAARSALLAALKERRRSNGGDITPDMPISELAELWFSEISEQDKSPNTLWQYRARLDNQIIPTFGKLRIREVTVWRVDQHVAAVVKNNGAGVAKMVRTVLGGVLGLATRNDALDHNPIRDVARINTPVKKTPRALTAAEAKQLREALRNDDQAIARDLLDLVDFLLATGVRITEAMELVWDAVHLDAATVEIRMSKSDAGVRTLQLPTWAVTMLRRRLRLTTVENLDGPVFPSPKGNVRNRSNTTSDLRVAFDKAGFDWVSAHTFRKTVATWMDEAGCSARAIADQLGHSKVSMTQDVYLGRKIAVTGAAGVLESRLG